MIIMEFLDEYEHKIPGVMYFPRSLPSGEVQGLYEYSLEGCNCDTNCTNDKTCSCMKRSGTHYNYESIYDIRSYTIHENVIKSPIYECNENCKCRDRICGNKLVQYGPRTNLDVKHCRDDKGLGLFTCDGIKPGNFVCEYAGEIISENEALKRFNANSAQGRMNYIFCIKEHFGENTVKTFIDPTFYGNIGRYVNHSCEPNCRLYVVRLNDTMPILGIFAKEHIGKNEEITYDYGETEPAFDTDKKFTLKKCYCGSERCRKYLPFDASLATI